MLALKMDKWNSPVQIILSVYVTEEIQCDFWQCEYKQKKGPKWCVVLGGTPQGGSSSQYILRTVWSESV